MTSNVCWSDVLISTVLSVEAKDMRPGSVRKEKVVSIHFAQFAFVTMQERERISSVTLHMLNLSHGLVQPRLPKRK